MDLSKFEETGYSWRGMRSWLEACFVFPILVVIGGELFAISWWVGLMLGPYYGQPVVVGLHREIRLLLLTTVVFGLPAGAIGLAFGLFAARLYHVARAANRKLRICLVSLLLGTVIGCTLSLADLVPYWIKCSGWLAPATSPKYSFHDQIREIDPGMIIGREYDPDEIHWLRLVPRLFWEFAPEASKRIALWTIWTGVGGYALCLVLERCRALKSFQRLGPDP
jgi:hypothetical protein